MIWRLIHRFLNNERVVDKLAESYPIRRAAQWIVYFFHKNIGPQGFTDTKTYLSQKIVDRFNIKLEEKLKSIKEELEKQAKK